MSEPRQQPDREAISRREFAVGVREEMDSSIAGAGHHPWGAYTPSAFRHYIRRIALLAAFRRLRPFDSVLDVGAAEGFFMNAIREEFGAEVWGVDLSHIGVLRAKQRLGMTAGAADATALPFADGSFDVVFSTEVIEHVLDPDKMLAEMRRVARKWVLVTTPVSQTADEHEPDYELTEEGHVNNFDRATVEALFGPDARYGSFRNNSTLALLVAVGRYLPSPLRDWFYKLDHRFAQLVGSPDHRLKPLRNRDWLIVMPGQGATDGSPRWVCPRCRGEIEHDDERLRCTSCGGVYPAPEGVPDFFSAQ